MSKTVQMVQKEVQSEPKWSKNSPELSNMVQIHPKFFLKMTTVGATTVGVAAVRNNLEFGTIMVLWYCLMVTLFVSDKFTFVENIGKILKKWTTLVHKTNQKKYFVFCTWESLIWQIY